MKTKTEQIEQEAAEVAEAKKEKFFSASLLPLLSPVKIRLSGLPGANR